MASLAAPDASLSGSLLVSRFLVALRNGLLAALGMALLAFVFQSLVGPLFASVLVDETVTITLSRIFLILLPVAGYLAASTAARNLPDRRHALVLALLAVCALYVLVVGAQAALRAGPFAARPSLQFSARQTEEGILVESLVPGGTAETAGLQVGDLITAIRRDQVTLSEFNQRLSLAEDDDPFRLRFTRNGEVDQLTVRIVLQRDVDSSAIFTGLIIALAVAALSIYWPGALAALHSAGPHTRAAGNRLPLAHHRHLFPIVRAASCRSTARATLAA